MQATLQRGGVGHLEKVADRRSGWGWWWLNPLNPWRPTMVAALVSVVGVIAFGFGFGRVSGGTKLWTKIRVGGGSVGRECRYLSTHI